MKRIISFILIAVILAMSMSSCNIAGNTANDTATPESEAHVHSFSPATCAAPKTCTDCGYAEGEKLNRHEPNGDICSVCGLDFFEELVNLIKENDNGNRAKFISYVVDENVIQFSEDSKTIQIIHEFLKNDTSVVYYEVRITRGTMMTQQYEWGYSYVYYPSVDVFRSGSVTGTFDPRELALGKHFEWTSYRGDCDPTSEANTASVYIHDALEGAFISLLEKSDKNLRPSDYGFVNYD